MRRQRKRESEASGVVVIASDAVGVEGAIMAVRYALAATHRRRAVCLLVDRDATGRTIRQSVPRRFRDRVSHTVCGTASTNSMRPPQHLRSASAYRLFAPAILGKWHSRVVYLDTDALAIGPLDPLFSLDLGGHACGAAIDTWVDMRVRTCHTPEAQAGVANSPLPRSPQYLNAGVMVIDTAAWIRQSIAQDTAALLEQHEFPYPDQDALNIVLADRWAEIHPRYNVQTSIEMPGSDFSRVPDRALREQIAEAHEIPTVLHFCGTRKPWDGLPSEYPLEAIRRKSAGGQRSSGSRHIVPWA